MEITIIRKVKVSELTDLDIDEIYIKEDLESLMYYCETSDNPFSSLQAIKTKYSIAGIDIEISSHDWREIKRKIVIIARAFDLIK